MVKKRRRSKPYVYAQPMYTHNVCVFLSVCLPVSVCVCVCMCLVSRVCVSAQACVKGKRSVCSAFLDIM
eukprot:m.157304 g.157304  ORF g.157304 m.157304 type:complete len:69 (+) comp31049_c2_seq1:145-351(+)